MQRWIGGGRNPAYGPDNGGPPPQISQSGMQAFPGYTFAYPQPWYGGGASSSQGMWPQQQQQQQYQYPWSWHNPGRAPAGQPAIHTTFAAANMTNSTGGVGCEPGYNYFFPSEHAKVHVLRTGNTPPWQMPATYTLPFHAVHVPVNTTLGDLLRGFGAVNPDPRKNKVFEVHQGGNGKWYKGMAFKGDDDKDMEKTIKSVGWDQTRNGLPQGKPVVYLYVTRG